MALSDLQRVIETSLGASRAKSPGFAKGKDGELRAAVQDADAIWVEDLINGSWAVTVATVRGNGEPHAVLSFAVCFDGRIYFTATVGTVLSHNLSVRPAVALTCVGAHLESLMATGTAVLVGIWPKLDDAFRRQAESAKRAGKFMRPDWQGTIYELDLKHLWTTKAE